MRTAAVLLLLFSSSFCLQDQSIYKQIDEVSQKFTEDLKDGQEQGKTRQELAEKLRETIDAFRKQHGVTETPNVNPSPTPDRLAEFSKILDKIKEETNQKLQEYEKTKAKKEEERQQKKDKLKEQFDKLKNKTMERISEIKGKIQNSIKVAVSTVKPETRQLVPKLNNDQKKQLVEELFTVAEGLINATRAKKEEKKKRKEELKEELKPVVQEIIGNLKTKFDSWKQAKAEESQKKWEEIKEILGALKQKAQEKKEEKESWLKATWQAIEERVDGILEKEEVTSTVQPELKGTFLDEMSGTSAWQNVTWILLALCVFLTISLLILIFSQNSRNRNHYQILVGTDAASAPLYPKLQNEEQVI